MNYVSISTCKMKYLPPYLKIDKEDYQECLREFNYDLRIYKYFLRVPSIHITGSYIYIYMKKKI